MDLRKLTSNFSVSPQIAAADIAAIKAAGFRSVVCHRPDGESADQPLFQEIAEAAEAQGLTIRHQPVVSGKLTDADAAAFAAMLDELPKPVLAYCRTGTRSASLWSLATAARGVVQPGTSSS
jgi:sulfide:quinone oxidoreductase